MNNEGSPRHGSRGLRPRILPNAAVRGARAIAAAKRPKPPKPTEADLQVRLEAARMRVREIVLLRMKFWLPRETRDGLLDAEDWRRERVRFHHRIFEDFRAGRLVLASGVIICTESSSKR
jgi:hypothetical protein